MAALWRLRRCCRTAVRSPPRRAGLRQLKPRKAGATECEVKRGGGEEMEAAAAMPRKVCLTLFIPVGRSASFAAGLPELSNPPQRVFGEILLTHRHLPCNMKPESVFM